MHTQAEDDPEPTNTPLTLVQGEKGTKALGPAGQEQMSIAFPQLLKFFIFNTPEPLL